MAAVGILTLATVASLTLLGTSSGMGTMVLTEASQRVVLAGHEEEAAQWIATFSQAVRAMRSGATLPDHLTAAIQFPPDELPALRLVAMACQARPAQLRPSCPTLDHHLIDLPPPVRA